MTGSPRFLDDLCERALFLDPGENSDRVPSASQTAWASRNNQTFEARSQGSRTRCLRFERVVTDATARLALNDRSFIVEDLHLRSLREVSVFHSFFLLAQA